MNYFEKIPAKTQAVVLNGKDVKIDTEGMEATVVSSVGTSYIKVSDSTDNADGFVLEKGQSITLNGKFYIGGDSAEVRILYCRII